MARPRKGTALLKVTGAFEKNPNRTRSDEPIPPDGDLIKPKWLKGRGAKIWEELSQICKGMGTAARGDEHALAVLCHEQAEYEKAPSRYQTSRLNVIRAFAERFGICGAGSRAKLAATDEKAKDPADKYFNNDQRSSNEILQ